jgi:hypothetical protein
MAYGVRLASIAEEQIADFRSHRRDALVSSKSHLCSHLVAYWIKEQPLGRLLGEALDGGEDVRADLWHPLLPPAFHSAEAVHGLAKSLSAARNQFSERHPDLAADLFHGVEVRGVIDLFVHADSRHEAVVRFLDPPLDEERASRVSIPLLNPGSGYNPEILRPWNRKVTPTE